MRILSAALVGALAIAGCLLALTQQASAQYYYDEEDDYLPAPRPRYYEYDYVPARPRYRSERQYYNQYYGTYEDAYRGSPATLGYCQRHPGRCR
jgi:hypothetical protein